MKHWTIWQNIAMLAGLAAFTVWLALWGIPAFAQDKPCDYSSTAIDPIRAKIVTAAPTLEQLADQSKANDAEQAALIELDLAKIRCANSIVRVDLADASPEMLAAFTKAVLLEQEARAALFAGKLTFGEYNRAANRITSEMDGQFAEIESRLASRPRGDRGASIARGAAAGAQRALPTYNPFPKPLICTSTRRGTLVDTYCR